MVSTMRGQVTFEQKTWKLMKGGRHMVSGESVWEKESQSKCPKIAAAISMREEFKETRVSAAEFF